MSAIYGPGDTFRGGFSLRRIDTGQAANADSTPTITLYRNGSADGAVTLTPTQTSGKTGAYQVSGTIPGSYANGDVIEVLAEATVNSVTDRRWIYRGKLDATVASRSTLTAANVWDALTTGMTTAGSIGKRIVDYLTGDSFTRLGAPVGASISADIAGAKSSADTAASNSSTAASAATTAASNASDAAGYASAAATQSTNAAASAASADGKATTILSRLGAWTGTGINTILGALRAIAAKASGLTPTDISTGTTFDNTTDSAEAIRDRGDAAWTGGGGGGGGGGVTLRRGPYQGKVNDGRPGAVVPLSVLDMVTLVIDVVDENGDEVPTGTATYTTEVRDRAGATVSTGTATPSDDSTRGRILWDNAAEDTESARTLYLYITRTDGAQVDTLRTIVLSIT